MSWCQMHVDLKAIDDFIERTIMDLASRDETGVAKLTVANMLSPHLSSQSSVGSIQKTPIGLDLLSEKRRGDRLNRVIQSLVAQNRLKIVQQIWRNDPRLVALSILDTLAATVSDDDSDK